jgi:2'-hydroxyisoflavone reductase
LRGAEGMQLLILGGTLFLGRHLVDAALSRGHEVTLFNRGRTAPELFPDVEQLRGDRELGLGALQGRRWSAVLDTSGYLPRIVRASAAALADVVEHYVFVSSISVYGRFPELGMTERSALAHLPDPDSEDVEQHYGALKAQCERAVEDEMPGRVLVARAGTIVGPHDPKERYSYWVRRLAAGGRVLAPAPREQPVQLIDARDLADWLIRGAERRLAGVFNITGPKGPLSLGSLLEQTSAFTGAAAEIVWVAEAFLLEHEVEPWDELPLWLAPNANPDFRGMLAVDVQRAPAAGLTHRPLGETVADTLRWLLERPGPPPRTIGTSMPHAGLSRAREAELLAAWDRRRQ